jgi:hypothetical protein
VPAAFLADTKRGRVNSWSPRSLGLIDHPFVVRNPNLNVSGRNPETKTVSKMEKAFVIEMKWKSSV